MTNKIPLRFTILHLAHRFRMDGETLMLPYSLKIFIRQAKTLIILAVPHIVQISVTSRPQVESKSSARFP